MLLVLIHFGILTSKQTLPIWKGHRVAAGTRANSGRAQQRATVVLRQIQEVFVFIPIDNGEVPQSIYEFSVDLFPITICFGFS
jgi:hypothetical protein